MAVKSWVLRERGDDEPELSMKARMVALVIANHMWTAPAWTLGWKLIAKEAGTSERSAWAGVAELERAGMFTVESGSTAGAKRANTYRLCAPFTTKRPKDDPRNSCEGRKTRPSQKVRKRKARPSQKVRTTLATVANTTLIQPLKDSTLPKTADVSAAIRRIESNEERMRRIS